MDALERDEVGERSQGEIRKQVTEVVYICTPGWQHYLFTSLRSLLASGTSFDRVVIYCVGNRPGHWQFEDSRIVVEEVPTLIDGYFFGNKTYLCQRQADRVLFLDADTMILKPLESMYAGVDSDFLGRPASGYRGANWNQDNWISALRLIHAAETPYFNSGVLVFQNGSHRRLDPLWLELTRRLLVGDLMALKSLRFADQFALSLAIGAAGLSYHLLGNREHAYGWDGEPYEDAVVFHNGGPGFLHMATRIERSLGIADLDLPVFHKVAGVNTIKLHRKLRHARATLKGLIKARVPWIASKRGW